MQYKTQLEILESVQSRFDSSLHDIAQLVRADLFDSELDSARELANSGFLRGAGAIAGVVLEKHLGEVCQNHNVVSRKQHPTISDFNDLLKNASVIDVPVWRRFSALVTSAISATTTSIGSQRKTKLSNSSMESRRHAKHYFSCA